MCKLFIYTRDRVVYDISLHKFPIANLFKKIHSLFQIICSFNFVLNQVFLILTKFIEKYINI